ncbi:MAG: hypothetical protein ACTHOG_12840 [Marmoricola sp.]|jgi:hypothetical protein
MIDSICTWFGGGLFGAGLLCLLLQRDQLGYACYALGGFIFYIAAALRHSMFGQLWEGAYTSFWVWMWWKGGGGDDTKRRLKKWARKFTPVRRTAPQLT